MASRIPVAPGRFFASASRLTPRTSSSLAARCSRPYSSQPPKPRRNDEVKFWPFLAVIIVGTGGYMALAKHRHGEFDISVCFLVSHVKELWLGVFLLFPLCEGIILNTSPLCFVTIKTSLSDSLPY